MDSQHRVWVPGCSTGEEAYSIAITLLEYVQENHLPHRIQIFGTDLSDTAIDRARDGFYGEGIKVDVSPSRVEQFFTRVGKGYRINRMVRDLCIFTNQDVTLDPPFSRLDLVSCRNLMIYLGVPLQRRVFGIFHYAMMPAGFLVLGNAESIGATPHLFSLVDKNFACSRRSLGAGTSVP